MKPELFKMIKEVALVKDRHRMYVSDSNVILIMPHDLFRAVTMIAGIEIVRADVGRPYYAYQLEMPGEQGNNEVVRANEDSPHQLPVE